MEIFCSCDGSAPIEIKYPASLIGKVPSVENYHQLELSDGQIKIKRNSKYYFKIQAQMALAERIYYDFLYSRLVEMQQFN